MYFEVISYRKYLPDVKQRARNLQAMCCFRVPRKHHPHPLETTFIRKQGQVTKYLSTSKQTTFTEVQNITYLPLTSFQQCLVIFSHGTSSRYPLCSSSIRTNLSEKLIENLFNKYQMTDKLLLEHFTARKWHSTLN